MFMRSKIKVSDRNRYIGNTNFFAKISTLISTFEAENEKNLSTYEAENGKQVRSNKDASEVRD